ncbi:primosomal protein N' [Desulfosarcina sp. OttesenSCG-928-G17]|nr:primosomal protein N' [Desulfosarcina sp. OttesenSCG-928-G17]
MPVISVAVPLPVKGCFDYTVPTSLAALLCPGKRVKVPFGNRIVTGYVMGPGTETDPARLKQILDILDTEPLFPETAIPFFRWTSDYYLHPIGQVISTALPAGLNFSETVVFVLADAGKHAADAATDAEKAVLAVLGEKPLDFKGLQKQLARPVARALVNQMIRRGWLETVRRLKGRQTRPKTVRVILLPDELPDFSSLSPQRQAILNLLRENGAMEMPVLKAHIPTAATLVRAMEREGQVRISTRTVYRDPFGDPIQPDMPPPLTDEQAEAVFRMTPLLGKGFHTVLLAGVTGSGKTEIYLQLTRAAMDQHLPVVVLVPEIALISQTERRFRARFGETVAVLHSGLSQGERYDQWLRILKGEAQIAIGARSAIFAPFQHAGLIIVDEEHDASYKQDTGLAYNARDLAVVRGRFENALVVLGSATPSIQSWHNVGIGKYTTVSLTQRVTHHPLPVIQTVDLSQNRDERGIRRYITPVLEKAIQTTLDSGHQALLFLNRRGFSAFPICGRCGKPIRCRHCDISLTLHKHENTYRCHYCGFSRTATAICPECGGETIKLLGIGTEKIQDAMTRLFPRARVARMDRDTTAAKGAMVKLLRDLKQGNIDILVGTQMVAKGHDFPGITLVGVICADLTLNFPDFRAGERTFQLLAQVAGRAGRGDQPGKVILQTFNPDHFSIMAATRQDFTTFYNQEIGFRKALGYPPFTRMIAIRLAGKDPAQTAASAHAVGAGCQALLSPEGPFHGQIQVMGPIPAPVARIANHHRWQLLVKGTSANLLHRFVEDLTSGQKPVSAKSHVRITLDVDPFYLM